MNSDDLRRAQQVVRRDGTVLAGVLRAARLAQVAGVVARRSLLPHLRSVLSRRSLVRPAAETAHDLAETVERLGPAFVKFAQIASTREDVLPPGVCARLSRLHDRVAPMSRRELDRSLAEGYGDDWERHLGTVSPAPLGAGSIACVYSLTARDDEDLVLKLRRPSISRRMRRDIDLVVTVCRFAEKLPPVRRVPLGEMAEAVGSAVLGQLDMIAESRNLARLGQDLRRLEFITVPRPVSETVTEHGFAMTYVPGADRPVELDGLSGPRRRLLAEQVLKAVFEMLFSTGMVHCDLHPGNLRLTSHGSITILDGGFVYRVPERTRRLLATFFLNLGFRNGPACATAVMSSATDIRDDADVDAFRAEIIELVDRYGGATARDFDLVEFSKRLFGSQRRNGIFASSEFAFPLLALLMVENTVRRLDPDVDFQGLVRPIVFRAAQGRAPGMTAGVDAENVAGPQDVDRDDVRRRGLGWSASWGLSVVSLENPGS
ncbi:hypothetical protein GCM10009676_25000 [Prauserella halophila]|uniref:Protein kinase domain-containing protein n=1 Tax=Prauserella halophila TaxID=185641 RepID=A0ABN1W7Y0_9PSEU|nr:AarF/UbiB family protein [Prauserella halophila]MCP2234884.1 ubiquinone biosynthesis protein [Prauserella halophila]